MSNDARHQALGITNTCYERTSFSIIWVIKEYAQIHRPDLNSHQVFKKVEATNQHLFLHRWL